MSKFLKLLLFAAVSAQTIPAAGKDGALVLKASSPWNLRYDEDKCRMARNFGAGETQVTLLLDQSGVEPYYTLSLIGRPLRTARGQFLQVRFGEEQPTERSFVTGKLEDKTPLVVLHGLNLAPVPPLDGDDAQTEAEIEPIGPDREAAISRIAVVKGLNDPLLLETGSLGQPLAAMRECVADLVSYLGAEEGPNPKISRRPEPETNPGSWATPNDYPAEMLRRDVEGLVRFRLTVNGEGRPTSCHITRSTRPQVFDDVVCLALLKRAKFAPALDQDGKPVAAYWSSAVRFELPD